MRAFDGQFSDNRPIRRTLQEKKRLLAELKETLANLKPQAAASLRTTLLARIKEIETEIANEPPPRAAGPREGGRDGAAPRPRRTPREWPPRE